MPQTADVAAPFCRLSPIDCHFFFGYYDVPAGDAAGRHLCQQVEFRDRFPTPDDGAALGWIPVPALVEDCQGAPFEIFARTHAWNFQQGAMLQWLPSRPDWCLHNTFEGDAFGCCIRNVVTGEQQCLPRAVANVAQDGSKALCVNMPRIFDFRPGYGYEELPDPHAGVPAPEDDGVFVMDLHSGDSRMILSLSEAVEFLAAEGEQIADKKVVINHITFNPSGERYLFLLRSFPEPGRPWNTWLLTADTAGGGLRHHQAFGLASHYHWRDDRHMLFYMRTDPQQLDLVLVDDDTDGRDLVDAEFFKADGHCSYSPDGRWLLYDSYPDASTPDFMRTLLVYSLERKEGCVLGRFRAEPYDQSTVDLRCDLHPRWMPDGRSISFDSIHEGFRGLYWMDLGGIVG
jgi:hypothetical protein